MLALRVLLYTCGAVAGGLAVAFGLTLLLAAPARAATAAPTGGVLGPAASAVSGTVTGTAGAVTGTVPKVTSAAVGTVSTTIGAVT